MKTSTIIGHLKRGESYGSPYRFVINDDYDYEFNDCKEILLTSFNKSEEYIFDYCGYIRADIWDIFVKIWSELGMQPIKCSKFIPNILGAKHNYNVVRFVRAQPVFKKIIIFDIFVNLLSLIHQRKITTAGEFFEYSHAIYSILFENKNLWEYITIDILCSEYFRTDDFSRVGAIYNAAKIEQIFKQALSEKKLIFSKPK